MQAEIATFVGHGSDITQVAWHPLQEDVFVSGGHDGSMCFWLAGSDSYVEKVPGVHDGTIYTFGWNPAGHLLVSGGGDAAIKFWCRGRPGDPFLEQQRAAQMELLDPNEMPLGGEAGRMERRDPRVSQSQGHARVLAAATDPRQVKHVGGAGTRARADVRIQRGKQSAVPVGRRGGVAVGGGTKTAGGGRPAVGPAARAGAAPAARAGGVKTGGVKKVTAKKKTGAVVAARRK